VLGHALQRQPDALIELLLLRVAGGGLTRGDVGLQGAQAVAQDGGVIGLRISPIVITETAAS